MPPIPECAIATITMTPRRPLATLVVLIVFVYFSTSGSAFAPRVMIPSPRQQIISPSTPISQLAASADDSPSFMDNLTQRYQLFQKSRSDGYNFKQSTAVAIAGEYDVEEVQSKINDYIDSAPCVMFTWEASPSCKKAIKYLDIAGASYKIVRLDNPWTEGNPIRAELGKMVGRSSVPAIFIGGKYVGGFDGGVGEESPGILEMAFKGTLREKLKEVGALKSEDPGED
jgi:glutaredoxin 3